MPEDTASANSAIEIQIGQNRIHVEGSEDFISDELPDILEWVGNNHTSVVDDTGEDVDTTSSAGDTSDTSDGEYMSLDEDFSAETGQETTDDQEDAESDPLQRVAESINVNPDKLSEHFYVDDDGVGIQDPRKIEPKYALLGYGIIRKELTGETYLDNRETKEKLIDQEMVDISSWGSHLLYNLRRNGLVKDDPNTDKGRNKPFKITPKGFDEFIKWLEEEEA